LSRVPGGRSRCGNGLAVQTVEATQLGDDLGQAAALDELHGVERHTPLGPDRVDGHDIGVVQAGRRLGLELEPLQLSRIHGPGERQDLQCYAAAQGDLLSLEDHPHPAPADLSDESEISEDLGLLLHRRPWIDFDPGSCTRAGCRGASELGHQLDRREQPPQLLGALRKIAGKIAQDHPFPGLDPVGQLFGPVGQGGIALG